MDGEVGVAEYGDVEPELVDRLREVCLALPDAYEEKAWAGTRWRVRKRTFAHVLEIEGGSPPAYARAAGYDGPMTVVTFRAEPVELEALCANGYPFRKASWGRDVVVLALDEDTDWGELRELLTESYCVLAPRKLARLVRE